MSGDPGEEGILEEMDRVRGDLGGGIDRLTVQMRNLVDWQSYVRSAPLTSVAIAATAGYLIAPAIRSRRVRLATGEATAAPARTGMLGMLGNVVLATITQAASLYIGELLTRELTTYSPSSPTTTPTEQTAFDTTKDLGDQHD